MVDACFGGCLMEPEFLSEQNMQETAEASVQKRKSGRSREEKVGRIKYQTMLLKEVKAQNKRILEELRWIRHGLKRCGFSSYEPRAIEDYACVDQVDREILQKVREAGDAGILPQDVAVWVNKLGNYRLKYYHVSRRIMRMNRRLHFETGEMLFEKRGHKWALTQFAFESFGLQ